MNTSGLCPFIRNSFFRSKLLLHQVRHFWRRVGTAGVLVWCDNHGQLMISLFMPPQKIQLTRYCSSRKFEVSCSPHTGQNCPMDLPIFIITCEFFEVFANAYHYMKCLIHEHLIMMQEKDTCFVHVRTLYRPLANISVNK